MPDQESKPKLYIPALLSYYFSLLSIIISIAVGLYMGFIRLNFGTGNQTFSIIIMCVLLLVSLALGVYSLIQLKKNGLRGKGLAITGIVLSSIFIVGLVISIVSPFANMHRPPLQPIPLPPP